MNIVFQVLVFILVITAPLAFIHYIENNIDHYKKNKPSEKQGTKQLTDNKNT